LTRTYFVRFFEPSDRLEATKSRKISLCAIVCKNSLGFRTASTPKLHPDRLPDGAPMNYAPENELGVVFLFSHLAKKRGLKIQTIRPGFPDCIAHRDGKRIRIEFELRSRNFAQHKHDRKKCDWIVCWVHDWPAVPPNLHVWELQREYGLGFKRLVPASRTQVSRASEHDEVRLVLERRLAGPQGRFGSLLSNRAPETRPRCLPHRRPGPAHQSGV
jgi:hypothetical protein